MQNRKHFPVSLKSVKKLARGDSRYLCKNSVTCMVWQDKKPITFISNFHDPEQTGVATRRNKDGTLLEITMPQLVKDYNLYMGGCEKWPNDPPSSVATNQNLLQFIRLYLSKQAKKTLYFTRYSELCLELIGEFRTAVSCPQRLLPPGQHFPEIPPEETKSGITSALSAWKSICSTKDRTLEYLIQTTRK